jgi:hypothetical protein
LLPDDAAATAVDRRYAAHVIRRLLAALSGTLARQHPPSVAPHKKGVF